MKQLADILYESILADDDELEKRDFTIRLKFEPGDKWAKSSKKEFEEANFLSIKKFKFILTELVQNVFGENKAFTCTVYRIYDSGFQTDVCETDVKNGKKFFLYYHDDKNTRSSKTVWGHRAFLDNKYLEDKLKREIKNLNSWYK